MDLAQNVDMDEIFTQPGPNGPYGYVAIWWIAKSVGIIRIVCRIKVRSSSSIPVPDTFD